MIYTTAAELKKYVSLNPYFEKAFRELEILSESEFAAGRYSVDGDTIFINAAEYETHSSDSAFMEAHKSYIDVMWMLSGKEEIAVCPVTDMKEVTKEYDPLSDALLGKLNPNSTTVYMKPDTICIFFPEDAHAPGLQAETRCHIRKLIAKVAVK